MKDPLTDGQMSKGGGEGEVEQGEGQKGGEEQTNTATTQRKQRGQRSGEEGKNSKDERMVDIMTS